MLVIGLEDLRRTGLLSLSLRPTGIIFLSASSVYGDDHISACT